jgi:hypothetical protein
MQQKRILPDRIEKTWTVDVNVLRAKLPGYTWLKKERLLARDLTQMSEYLPHWILTLGKGLDPIRSSCCSDNVAPIEGELRCILCNRITRTSPTALLWTGLLPVNLEGRERILRKVFQARERGKLNYPIVAPEGKHHLLVPVIVEYPQNWPYSPPRGHYADRQFLDLIGTVQAGAAIHMLGDRTMCLYHAAQWNDNNTIMHVVANRIAPHAFAIARLANGESSIEFFNTDYGYYDR